MLDFQRKGAKAQRRKGAKKSEERTMTENEIAKSIVDTTAIEVHRTARVRPSPRSSICSWVDESRVERNATVAYNRVFETSDLRLALAHQLRRAEGEAGHSPRRQRVARVKNSAHSPCLFAPLRLCAFALDSDTPTASTPFMEARASSDGGDNPEERGSSSSAGRLLNRVRVNVVADADGPPRATSAPPPSRRGFAGAGGSRS